jgi:hypothetical protein
VPRETPTGDSSRRVATCERSEPVRLGEFKSPPGRFSRHNATSVASRPCREKLRREIRADESQPASEASRSVSASSNLRQDAHSLRSFASWRALRSLRSRRTPPGLSTSNTGERPLSLRCQRRARSP